MGPVDGDPFDLRCNSAQALLKILLLISQLSLMDIHNQYLGCKWPHTRAILVVTWNGTCQQQSTPVRLTNANGQLLCTGYHGNRSLKDSL